MSTVGHYPTDVSDAQWGALQLLPPTPKWRPGGPGRKPMDLRRVLNGIFYVSEYSTAFRRWLRVTTQGVSAAQAASLPAQAGSSRGGGPSAQGSPHGGSPAGDASPSSRNPSSLSGDCGAIYALLTASVTWPRRRQQAPRAHTGRPHLRKRWWGPAARGREELWPCIRWMRRLMVTCGGMALRTGP
jgi:hypothetical protein